ncbi:MAG: tRNA lysidine(34) synthetase TilS [Anaerolineae bacterium]|nr:tRNA lysidine(34) synthetase TilS [Anaerolineae bacterium]
MRGIEYKAGMNLTEQLFAVIRAHNLLPYGAGSIVVGVSGGADSLALLHLLANLRGQPGLEDMRLHVATLDHGLRGAAGADDARFVVETARAWGLPVTAGKKDVRALADEHRMSVEAAARAARYDFLASVAQDVGAERIAVAHNADDQVETILLHLLRGASLSGLAGMAYVAPLPEHPDLTLIRPLLGVPRADLDAYCREHGLQPRRDASNDDTRYTRNRLRLDVIPKLRDVSPQVDRRLLQLAEIAALEDDFADRALHEVIDQHVARSEGRIRLPNTVFRGLHPALQRRLIIWAVGQLGGAADVSYVHVVAAVRLANEGNVGGRAQLKGGVQLRVDYDLVVVERDDAPIDDEFFANDPATPPQRGDFIIDHQHRQPFAQVARHKMIDHPLANLLRVSAKTERREAVAQPPAP